MNSLLMEVGSFISSWPICMPYFAICIDLMTWTHAAEIAECLGLVMCVPLLEVGLVANAIAYSGFFHIAQKVEKGGYGSLNSVDVG